MKNRFITVTLLLVLLISLTGNAQAIAPNAKDQPALVFVDIAGLDDLTRFALTQLPLFAQLEHGLLTGADRADQQTLREAGLIVSVLDPDLHSGSYYLASTHTSRPLPNYASYGQVLLSTDHGVLLRMDPSRLEALAQAGAELKAITLTPKPLPASQVENIFPDVVDPDPIIQGMVDQVTDTQVYTYDRQLAGELPVWVDGAWYTINTRSTYSGVPIQKTTSFVGQHMADLGMNVEYHPWGGATYPNVIGEISGITNPDDIYIIGAHIDDVSGTKGADDNASGSVATLLAADILSQFQWGCTLRFAFWTGEEYGLLGSEAYAHRAFQQGENILGYLNLDMIAWNDIVNHPDPTIYLGYDPLISHSLEFANLFASVIGAYNIDLVPVLGTQYRNSSDHGSFLDYGYPAILGIEGNDDFNPYYHGPGDTPAHTDPTYFTNYVKASIATYAHMTECLIPSGVGHLDGHVTASDGGAPIADATLVASDGIGHAYPATTDASGYYTRTLMSGTYTVTATAYAYLPATVSAVTITTNTVTTRDFYLVAAPTHIVSGTVTESGSGLPLSAQVSLEGSFDVPPTIVWTDPATGFYQAELPEDGYTMHIRADLHRPQERTILLDQNQTQDFSLDPLPCVLLVDDDQDAPDLNSYYITALDGLGVDYDVWDTQASGNPAGVDIAGYQKLLWYTGGPSSDTFNTSNESAVGTYLDGGGNFFLSSHEYLWENGLTTFGQNYLHILNYTNDVRQTTVTGQNVFSGLGPYTLSYPFTNWSDRVSPNANAQLAFSGNLGNAGISYNGDTFRSVFIAYPFEAISQAAGRMAVMNRLLGFFGACSVQSGRLEGLVTDASTGVPLEGVQVMAVPDNVEAGIQSITDPNGYYSMTLEAGDYLVSAMLDGYVTQSQPATITAGGVTTLDFALETVCTAVTNLDFTWLPLEPPYGEPVSFTATASGTHPIDFQWSFGDTFTGTGTTVIHTYAASGTYPVDLTASNACGTQDLSKNISIMQRMLVFFLPLLTK